MTNTQWFIVFNHSYTKWIQLYIKIIRCCIELYASTQIEFNRSRSAADLSRSRSAAHLSNDLFDGVYDVTMLYRL